ncbi:MAG: aldo/keto reductase [Pseudolabrys sp.]
MCNQIEMHPFINQDKVLRRARSTAWRWSLIARSRAARCKAPKIFGADALERIGAAHGKSAAQVSLRYLVQMGVVAIPRTGNPDHLKANLDVFDFKLSDAEMAELKKLNATNMRVVNPPHAPVWDTP